ncbi:unnamed protein product [Aureobasidium mustum]|uniref:Zn(2)-C6 fungal-type domain-containing protein n=1 Tax=Aureobasidium mustum TaxID=2773714 RepID=A0A9N8JUL0_9PEZI|nr:unnamed protein product [Aureobasidium mustum]
MNIAAMLEPMHDAPTAPSASSPLQPSSLQRLPSITHVTSALQQQNEHQPLSSHRILQQSQPMPELQSSLPPPPRHVLPQRMDSMSSTSSSTQGSTQFTPQQFPASSTQRTVDEGASREELSASPPQASSQTRHRGKQTKAACIPCRRRKSKCDGIRPSCKCCISKATPCQYSVTPGVTQQQAMKNQLEAYKHVLSLLRESTMEDAEVLVKMIKARESLSDAVADIQIATRQHHPGYV